MLKSPRPRRYSLFRLSWSDMSTSAQFAFQVASTTCPILFQSGVSLISATCSSATLPILLAIIIASLFDFAFELMPTLAANPRLDAPSAIVLVRHFHRHRSRMPARKRRRRLFVGDSKSAHLYGQLRSGERPPFDLVCQVPQVHDSLEIQFLLRHGLTPSWVHRRREPHVKLQHHPVVTGIRLVKLPPRLNGDDGHPFHAVCPTSERPSRRGQCQPNRPGEVVSLFVRRRPAVELHPSAGKRIGVALLGVLICCDDAIRNDRQRLTLRDRQGINAVADDGRYSCVIEELASHSVLDHAASILRGAPPLRLHALSSSR